MHKFRPGVPVHVSDVPVQLHHCPLLNKLYRYMFKLYRYIFATTYFRASCTGTCLSCTGTTCSQLIFSHFSKKKFYFFFIFFLIYKYIYFSLWNSGATIHFDLSNCLSSRVVLHVGIPWDTFNLSIRSTTVPQIRIPKFRINLTT